MSDTSKPIKKTDDESKQFIIDCLENEETHGFDIDSIYYYRSQWYVFEYLKCENEHMSPYTSNPKYYPWNWKKFYSLFLLAQGLKGRLFLVNYSTRESDKNQVKVMEVLGFNIERIKQYEKEGKKGQCDYLKVKESKMTLDAFRKRLQKINAGASMPHIEEPEV